ncbi:MAG TPA: hypothetical protein VM782_04330 [Stellaceae bacterium]|nr:hypothetical protein [Stellaceae bacterium]
MTDLAKASAAIAELAHTIQRANPVWAAASVQVLISVNETIVRLQNKGAEAFSRYLAKHPAAGQLQLAGGAGTGDQAASERSTPQNEEEG